jgi:hypothetical protein
LGTPRRLYTVIVHGLCIYIYMYTEGSKKCTHSLIVNIFWTKWHVVTILAQYCSVMRDERFYLQQDGAPPHYHRHVRAYLDDTLPGRWIGQRGTRHSLILRFSTGNLWPERTWLLSPTHSTFLFSWLKIKLKDCHFDTIEVIDADSHSLLNILTEHDFQEAVKKCQKRWEQCIRLEVDYFEGEWRLAARYRWWLKRQTQGEDLSQQKLAIAKGQLTHPAIPALCKGLSTLVYVCSGHCECSHTLCLIESSKSDY